MQRVQRSQPGLPTFPGRETHRLNLSLRRAAVAALVVLAAVLFGGGAAWAAVLVSNIGQTALDGGDLVVSPRQHLAQGFTTGSSPVTLTSIEIRLDAAAAMAAPPTVTVHRGTETGPQLASLTGPANIATAGTTNVTFTAASPLLTPATTYFVVLQHTVANSINAKITESDAWDSGGATGWSIADAATARPGGTGSFTDQAVALLIRVNGTVGATPTVPGPPESLTATVGDTVVVLNWDEPGIDGGTVITRYEYRHAAATTWTPVGTARFVRVTGLTNDTQYAFEVRAVNSVGAGTAATVTATPTPPTVGTLVSNAGKARANDSDKILAQQFTTGGNTLDYLLSAVHIRATDTTGARTVNTYVTIKDDAGGVPGTEVGRLNNPATFAHGEDPNRHSDDPNTFAATGSIRLAATTAYWVVVNEESEGSRLHIAVTTADAEDSGALLGWSIANGRKQKNAKTDSWGNDGAVLLMDLRGHVATDPAVVPGPPQSLTTAQGDTLVELYWNAPASDGGTAITKYQYRYSAGSTVGVGATTWAPVGRTARSVRVTGLTNGTPYAFEVRAVNSVGAGTAATTMLAPVSCGVPSLTGRREIWSGTLTVEEYRNEDNIVLLYGFSFSLVDFEGTVEQIAYGGLPARTFTVSNAALGVVDDPDEEVSYKIQRVEYNVNESLYGKTLQFAIDKALPDEVRLQEGQLVLHICDQSFDLSEISRARIPHSTTNGDVHTYIWDNPELDWRAVTERPLQLSVPGSGSDPPLTSPDATLSALSLSDASDDDSSIALRPAFVSGTTSYMASVPNGVEQITIAPMTTNNGARVAYFNGSDTAIPDADTMKNGQQVSLAVGANTIEVKVTAADGTTMLTYTVTVTRAEPEQISSTDATLSALALSDAADDDSTIALSPPFASGTMSYTASVDNGVDEITIKPTVNESSATVEYLDSSDTEITDANSGKTGQQVSLEVGANTIKVVVTAEDTTTTDTYTVVVTRDRATGTTTGTTTGRRSPPSPPPPPPGDVVGYLENPEAHSFQSGIGVISGWVCDAEEVEITLNGEPQEAAYGTARLDTEAVCGDSDNGFGLLFNWNLLGDGEHEVVALVDGVELDRATVTVTTLGAEFLRDVTGTCTAADFPTGDETVTLAWQQTQQNFVIAEGAAPAGPTNRTGTPGVGYLENPGPNSFQSGIGVLSGWACEGTEVVIDLNGQPHVAAYGTERLDTLAACGDTANGFGLLFNWNLLGEGEHEVVAFVDAMELGRATVRVTTLGVEFLRGVTGECTVEDFPMPGETVALEWQQNSQNFVITDVE